MSQHEEKHSAMIEWRHVGETEWTCVSSLILPYSHMNIIRGKQEVIRVYLSTVGYDSGS